MTNPGELQATALEPGMGRSEDPNGRCVFFNVVAGTLRSTLKKCILSERAGPWRAERS